MIAVATSGLIVRAVEFIIKTVTSSPLLGQLAGLDANVASPPQDGRRPFLDLPASQSITHFPR